MIRIFDLENLKTKYGNIKIEDLIKILKEKTPFVCPKCDGKGTLTYEYNAYPAGLPDSGWVKDMREETIDCDLCNGIGYTSKQIKPKMIQDGWEEIN